MQDLAHNEGKVFYAVVVVTNSIRKGDTIEHHIVDMYE